MEKMVFNAINMSDILYLSILINANSYIFSDTSLLRVRGEIQVVQDQNEKEEHVINA